jgi:hypothetical protein
LIDREKFEELRKFSWRLRRSGSCFYAIRRFYRDGRVFYEKMHRRIAKTPKNEHCHHVNHNCLDNRLANLQNLAPSAHAIEHGIDLKLTHTTTPPNTT